MANPLQRAVVKRQIVYVAAIIGLLTLSNFVRGKFSLIDLDLADGKHVSELLEARRVGEPAPPSDRGGVPGLLDTLASRTILEQSSRESLDLREVEQGDAEVDSAFFRLALTGSRGFAVTVLWKLAQEYQKRNEYHKLEQAVNAVTRLQPNFTTPWLYQSWNISYNVSVENDRLTDQYYFIARGIELLAKGERLNRNSPDMRYYIAFYYQNKFSVHDKVNTLRSMMHLSTIPPSQRHPDRFRNPATKEVTAEHLRNFKEFVEKNPRLCRRLSLNLNLDDKYRQKRPVEMMDIVRFLEDNYRVPCRYDRDRNDRLLDANDQFPILPPADWGTRLISGKKVPVEVDEANSGKKDFDDTFDAFLAARSWFRYSTMVLPDPEMEPTGYRQLSQKEKFLYRIPKAPLMIIFRQQAMRAQTYYAEFLQKEGWFDSNSEWKPQKLIDFVTERARLQFLQGEGCFDSETGKYPKEWDDARIAKEKQDNKEKDWANEKKKWNWPAIKTPVSSLEAWKLAHRMWETHGVANGLVESPKFASYRELAGTLPSEDRLFMLDEEQLKRIGVSPEAVRARKVINMHETNLRHTNFGYFITVSEAESKPETARARAKIYDAEQLARNAKPEAVYTYTRALAEWRKVLADPKNKEYSRSDRPEEDTFETEMKLVQLLEKDVEIEVRAKANHEAMTALTTALMDDFAVFRTSEYVLRALAEREANHRIAGYHPEVVRKVNELLATKDRTAAFLAQWPEIDEMQREFAKAAFKKSKPTATPEETAKAGDDPVWREAAIKELAEKPEADNAWPPPPRDDRIAAREKAARLVIDRVMDWVPEYRSDLKLADNMWVRNTTKLTVRDRLPKPTQVKVGNN